MHATIKPVAVFPSTATRLFVRSGQLGPPPSFYWELQSVTVIPAPAPTLEQPDPQPSESTVCLKNGNTSMTDKQWDGWTDDQDDETYILSCVATNVGLEIIPTP